MLGTFGTERLISAVLSVVLVMVSASIHEFGHAYAAYRLGDDTAKRQGRLTINPFAHIDRFGSIILPLVMALAGGPVFAFAKPVPYNPNKLRNPRRDEVIVAFAGPATNLLQAAVGAVLCRLMWSNAAMLIASNEVVYWVYRALVLYVYLNCSLAFFNMIPLPPLDGSSIISPLLKGEARRKYYVVQHYALPILMIVLYVIPSVTSLDPVGLYLEATAGKVASLMLGW